MHRETSQTRYSIIAVTKLYTTDLPLPSKMRSLYLIRHILIPNPRHGRVSTILHLPDRASIAQKRKHVIRILVLNLIVLVPRVQHILQMMRQRSRPDVHPPVRFIVFVPGLALFGPDGVLKIPSASVRVTYWKD